MTRKPTSGGTLDTLRFAKQAVETVRQLAAQFQSFSSWVQNRFLEGDFRHEALVQFLVKKGLIDQDELATWAEEEFLPEFTKNIQDAIQKQKAAEEEAAAQLLVPENSGKIIGIDGKPLSN